MIRFVYSFCLFFAIAVPLLAQPTIENAFPALSFLRPVDFQHAGDASNRIFVVEQAGIIRVFENRRSVTSSKVFLDIQDRVNDDFNEEGLLGLAFHPTYVQNGHFYVNYTASAPRRTVISRFTVSMSDPDVADPASETIILEFNQPYSNHNGGQITFGPDGYLYIATGDGGSGGDPQNNSQNRGNLLGKILRIDVDAPAGPLEYGIPSDNPFVNNTAGLREEIWAYGLRNPWRFSFDPLTGKLWTGDVGQNRFEEVSIIEKGKNYGWRIMEGFECFNPSTGCNQDGLEKPVLAYGRSLGASITGGFVYRGSKVPELNDLYVYGDFVSGRIWGLRYNGPEQVTNTLLLASGQNISSFGVDEANELYLCTFGGAIYTFASTITSVEDIALPSALSFETIYPQPLSASSQSPMEIRFSIPTPGNIRLTMYDTLGREIRILAEGTYVAGRHSTSVSLSSLPPGVYFLSLSNVSQRATKKILIME